MLQPATIADSIHSEQRWVFAKGMSAEPHAPVFNIASRTDTLRRLSEDRVRRRRTKRRSQLQPVTPEATTINRWRTRSILPIVASACPMPWRHWIQAGSL